MELLDWEDLFCKKLEGGGLKPDGGCMGVPLLTSPSNPGELERGPFCCPTAPRVAGALFFGEGAFVVPGSPEPHGDVLKFIGEGAELGRSLEPPRVEASLSDSRGRL